MAQNVEEAYRQWASQYDSNLNKTRDLEGRALRSVLQDIDYKKVLELGCGTAKNTAWLALRAKLVTAVDLSAEMLAIAKAKVKAGNVTFKQANLLQAWTFADHAYDLITFSLVLEHLEELRPIFRKASKVLKRGGYLYVGELHPFKQYTGTKARYQSPKGEQVVACYTHHLSDFTQAANSYGFSIETVEEFFDDDDQTTSPRIITILFRKK